MSQENLLNIILAPHMSEKAAVCMEKNDEYVFQVRNTASKVEIKKAVEYLFKVNVEKVHVLKVKSKPKRFGQIEGKSKPWKKAYVRLQEGQKIDLAGNQ